MDEQEIDLRAIFGLIRRRLRLIIGVVVLVLVVTAGVVFTLQPEYTADTLVLVDPSRKDVLDPEPTATSSSSDSARVDSEVEIVKSMPTLLRVAEQLNLVSHPDFAPTIGLRDQLLAFFRIREVELPTGEEALNAVIGKLSSAVAARRRGLTYLISISAEAKSPETAADIANAVAEAYIASQIESKTGAVLATLELLEPRVAEASTALASSESVLDSFIDDNLDQIAEETGRQDIVALRRQLEEQNSERLNLSRLVEQASADLSASNFEQLTASLQSQAIASLEQQRQQLNARLNLVTQDSPEAIDLANSLADIEAQIGSEARSEIASLQQEIAATQDANNTLRNDIRQSVLSSNLPPQILTNIYELQQNSTLARTNYERLVARVNELRAQADLQVADSRIVAPATAPSSPSFPNTRLILILAALASLGLGIGLAFVVENFVGGFSSPEQLEAFTRQGTVTTIPLQKAVKKADGSRSVIAADAVALSPLSQFAEAFRHLRLRVEQAIKLRAKGAAPESGKLVVVTSSVPVEGKSTTALGLARTYSAAGSSVLLIDGDLRKPSVHRQINVQPSDGLFEFLSGRLSEAELSDIVVSDPLSQVKVIVGARHSETPTEQLLASATFQRLIKAGRAAFDVVIVDTPPVGVVVDGVYVLQSADAIVFVTRWSSTTQREVARSLQVVEQARDPETPVVLAMTQQPSTGAGYQSKYYSYYANS